MRAAGVRDLGGGAAVVIAVVVSVVLLLVAAILVAPVRVAALDRGAARRHGDAPLPDAAVEEIAVLAGGPRRVVETAVARLVEDGLLVVAPDRVLRATGRTPDGELDREVLATVATLPWPTAPAVVSRVQDGPAVEAVRDAARRGGLVHDDRAARRIRRDALLALGAAVVIAVVAAAVPNGPSGAGLGVVVVLGALVGVIAAVTATGPHRATRRGRATLAAATRAPAWGSIPDPHVGTAGSPVVTVPLGAAALVAVGGLARFPDDEVASLLAPPPSTSAGSGGGFGGDGGGGGCSDGGGGGGSC